MKLSKKILGAVLASVLSTGAFAADPNDPVTAAELKAGLEQAKTDLANLGGDTTEIDAAIAGIDSFITAKKGIDDGLDAFGLSLLTAAPQASSNQNLWADAYIGKFFPSVPPHFGFGFTVGGTKLDMSGFKNAASSFESSAKNLGANLDFGKIPSSFFLPVISVDARVGGIVLPFDVGFSLMMTSPALFDMDMKDADSILGSSGGLSFGVLGFDGQVSYLTMGVDVRYPLLKGGLILPKVSIGAGYIYTRGQFGASASSGAADANIEMAYTTHVLYLQAQASKSFLIATVFGGGRALLSDTTTAWAYDMSYTTSVLGNEVKIKETGKGSRTANGKSDTLKSGSFDFSGIQPQLYAGVSLNFLVFQTSLSACCDVRSFFDDDYKDALWSGALSFHFKL